MRHLTIDQAGKIENTNEDTIIAFHSKEIQYSIKVPKKLKQKIFNLCYKKYKKRITLQMFSFCVGILLNGKIEKDSIILLDNEYDGHGEDIKNILMNFIDLPKEFINIVEIGKKDPAHSIANKTLAGKLKPNEILCDKKLSLKKLFSSRRVKKLLK